MAGVVPVPRAVAEPVPGACDHAVVARDVRPCDARVPVAYPVAHAERELVGIGRLQLVVDEVHLAEVARRDRRQPFRRQVGVVPLDALCAGIHRAFAGRIVRVPELDRRHIQRRLVGLVLQDAEYVAVIAPGRAAEDHVRLVGEEVVGKAEPRRDLVARIAAVAAVADVVVDVDAGVRQRVGVGLAGLRAVIATAEEIGRAVELVLVRGRAAVGVEGEDRVHEALRRDVVRIRRGFLVVVAHAEIQQQLVVHRPVVLDVEAVLAVLRGRGHVQVGVRLGAEDHLERVRLDPGIGCVGNDVERVERLRRGVAHLQLDVLELDAGLDGVLAGPARGR